MKKTSRVIFGIMCISFLIANGQTEDLSSVNWQAGPAVGNLGSVAEVRVPTGYVFADAKDTRILLRAMHNPTSGNELGTVSPEEDNWFVCFQFMDTGYIRDDEKNSLDADAMLKAIKKGTDAANKEREKNGWPALTILGWEQKPRYNEITHNLEWAIKVESEGQKIINYSTRILGRGGVMGVTLVADPETLSATLPKFKNILAGFDYKPGGRYAEYREGDKVAKYGLSALVVGGAAAVAVKTGLFKWVWKGLVIGAVAISSFFKRIFSRKKLR
jgi:uncharacterized membrane-anchored protein